MVFCFGELLLRMSPALGREWIRQSAMPVFVGGAELNVATALAAWETPVRYTTALPANYLTQEIVQEIQEKGIDTSYIHYSGQRIGTYYLPQGADLKNAGVIYDRAFSSFWDLKPGMIDWDTALEGCTWFHFTAISPALNADVAAVCLEGVRAAAAKGLTISVDLNYRAKLWQYGKPPAAIMPELVQHCQVIMGNIWSVESLLGMPSPVASSAGKTKEELAAAAGESMLNLHKQYVNATTFAYTFRLDDAYWAILQHGPEQCISPEFDMAHAADRIGSGDCFMGGLIYGLYYQHQPQDIIDYAAAAAVGKLGEKGDATRQTVTDVQRIAAAARQNQPVWSATNK